MNNLFYDLWHSTIELPKRFNLIPSVEATGRKFFEEVYEFTKAVEFYDAYETAGNKQEICKEGADVIVMVLQRLNSLGITWDELVPFIEYTIDKNDAKTPYTHEVINGIIKNKEGHGITSDAT